MASSADHADFNGPHKEKTTVVVVGAGPAGLMLAYVRYYQSTFFTMLTETDAIW